MVEFTTMELEAAQKAILSAIRKSEKVQETLSGKQVPPTSKLTLVSHRLNVLNLASSMIKKALNEESPKDYSKEDLEEAIQIILSLIQQVEKIMPKFNEGAPQHTLAIRRIKAFQIALALIERALAQDSIE